MASTYILRGTNQPSGNLSVDDNAAFLPDWRDVLASAHRSGDSGAAVQMVEFADFECPFCARFRAILDSVRAERPGAVAVVFVHFPIKSHRFAIPAARAAECAARQDRFDEYGALLFAKQDSLGLKSFSSFAVEAGVRDTAAFARCSQESALPPLIARGQALARQWQIHGTPGVLLNGWKQPRPPDHAAILRFIDSVMSARQ